MVGDSAVLHIYINYYWGSCLDFITEICSCKNFWMKILNKIMANNHEYCMFNNVNKWLSDKCHACLCIILYLMVIHPYILLCIMYPTPGTCLPLSYETYSFFFFFFKKKNLPFFFLLNFLSFFFFFLNKTSFTFFIHINVVVSETLPQKYIAGSFSTAFVISMQKYNI